MPGRRRRMSSDPSPGRTRRLTPTLVHARVSSMGPVAHSRRSVQ
jgi:hypothetical protein